MSFKLTNEQIVYIYTEYSKAAESIETDLQKQLEYIKGNIETLENVYGNDPTFNHQHHNLYKKLMLEEMPKRIGVKLNMLRGIKDVFEETYLLISEADPELVSHVVNGHFEESDEIKDIIKQLENTKNEPIN